MSRLSLGQKLRQRREALQLRQLDVAIRLGISQGTLSCYEADQVDIPTSRLQALALLYDTSPAWFLERQPCPECGDHAYG